MNISQEAAIKAMTMNNNKIKIAKIYVTHEDKVEERLEDGRVGKSVIFIGPTVEMTDGYHTMDELYDHRIVLYICLCRSILENDDSARSYGGVNRPIRIWRSKLHSDGSLYDGWFILGINKEKGKQISYHLPESAWSETDFADTLEKAPDYDGHTPKDVFERLKNL